MTSERILNAIAAYLRPKVTTAGGVFDLSADVASTLSLLGTSAGRFRVVLQWQRERGTENRGEREMTFLVIVQQGVSTLGINPGDGVSVSRPASMLDTTRADSTTSSLNNAPLLQRCTQVHAWVRAVKFSNADVRQQMPVCEPGNGYWLSDPNFPTKQIAQEFTVRFASELTTAEVVEA